MRWGFQRKILKTFVSKVIRSEWNYMSSGLLLLKWPTPGLKSSPYFLKAFIIVSLLNYFLLYFQIEHRSLQLNFLSHYFIAINWTKTRPIKRQRIKFYKYTLIVYFSVGSLLVFLNFHSLLYKLVLPNCNPKIKHQFQTILQDQ